MKQNYNGEPTRLRQVLDLKGIKQKDLAVMANVETYQISKLCSGLKSNVMLDTAKRIAKALNVTLDEAFGDN